MARYYASGPCFTAVGQNGGSGTQGTPCQRNSKDFTEMGHAWRSDANANLDIRNDVDAVNSITTKTNQIWYRFWIRMRRYPQYVADTFGQAAGLAGQMQGLSSCRNTIEGGVGQGLAITSGGYLHFINHGNLTNATLDHLWVCPFPLTLFTWYKIEVFHHNERGTSTPFPPLGIFRVIVSDTNNVVLADSGQRGPGVGTSGFGINANQNTYGVLIGDAFTSTNHGMDYDLSHIAIDDAIGLTVNDRIPDSRVTRVPVVATGTYQQWPNGNRSVEARGIYNSSGGQEVVSIVGPTGGRKYQTYRVKNLRSCGITGTIYHFRAMYGVTATGTPSGNYRGVLIVNGVIHETPSALPLGTTDKCYWFPGVTITPDDTIEIGVSHDTTSGTSSLGPLALIVDHDSPVTEIQTSDFQVGSVSWTGLGANTGQTIDLPFVPNFVYVHAKTTQPDPFTGGGAPGCYWWDTMTSFHFGLSLGPRRDQIRVVIDRQANTAQLQMAGDFDEFNTAGIEYYAVLIRDPTNRVMARGYTRQVSQTTPYNTDDLFYTVGEGTSTPGQTTVFTPLALFCYEESDNTSLAPRLRGPAQVGDASLPFGGGTPVTDHIQQLTTSGFQLGRLNAYQSNASRQPFLALRKDSFVSQKCLDIVTWKGAQPSSFSEAQASYKRRIAVDLSGRAPELIIAVADNNSPPSALWHAQMYGSTGSAPGSHLQGFSEATVDGSTLLDGEPVAAGMTIATNVGATGSKVIQEVWFYLKKTGNPTGPMRVKLFPTSGSAPTGTAHLAQSDAIDASTLTTSFQWVRFKFSTPSARFPMVRSTTYFASLEFVGTGTDYVEMGQDGSAPVGAGTKYTRSSLDVWTVDNTADLAHRIFVGGSMGFAQALYSQAAIVDYENDAFYVEEDWNSGTSVGLNSFGNRNSAQLLDTITATAQTFTCSANGTLAMAQFHLKRTGLPLGTLTYKIYATAAGVPTGAALATSEPLTVGDIDNQFSTVYTLHFTGANQISLVNGTVYAIAVEYTGGSVTDYVEVGEDNTPAHAGTKYDFSGGTWNADAGADLCFQVAVEGATTYTAFVFSIGLDALGLPPSGLWHEFLVAGHACKSIDAWYVGGIRQPTSSAEGDPDTEAYFLIPGYSAYESAFGTLVKTRTYNGRVYTCVYIKEGGVSPIDVKAIIDGDVPFSINVQGIETVGDGSGTLIEESFAVYKHLMQNWVFGDYEAGSWLTTPTFPDTDAVAMMNDQSFTDCAAIAARRISGGYKAAGALGSDGETISVRDLIRMLNVSMDCDSGLNRKCQFFVSMTDDSAVVALFSPELTDVGDILKATMEIEDDFSNHFNSIPYSFAKDYVPGSNTPWRASGVLESAESIANYLDTIVMNALEMGFVRDETTAKDIVRRKMLRHKDPPRVARFSTHAKGFNIELGDTRLVTHFGGIGSGGWTRQPVRVQKHIASPQGAKVDFEGYDMSRLFATVFILGDETVLQPLWTLAVGAFAGDRIYGYLGDETTSKFSDGEDAKRVR